MPDKRREDEQLPPIPDGGLAESMPDWLRRPPAWRTLQDSEVMQPEPARAGKLPDADSSVIDPRTLLTDDDLPEWLRGFGWSARSTMTLEHDARSGRSSERGAGGEQETATAPVASIPGPVVPSRFVPRSPVVTRRETDKPAPPRAASQLAQPTRAPVHRAAWWQGPQLAILLGVALLAALIVTVILLV